MTITSFWFLGFLAAALAVYYAVPGKIRWTVLLAASLVFYALAAGRAGLWLGYTALTVYLGGLALGRLREKREAAAATGGKQAARRYDRARKWVCGGVAVANFAALYALKYWNFTAQLFQPLVSRLFDSAQVPLLTLALPLGISFFMFQSVGYIIDVYRGKYPPQRNFCKLLLFAGFFPQMIQGPISRYQELAPQLYDGKDLDYTNLKYGIQLAMWGYFKKLVIADRAAVLVNTVMADPRAWSGAIQAVGILFYCIQLYGDFSGGIDVVRGAAKMFGIDLAENFKRPIFARSLTDFWRRWHVTLGGWMRDYLFYPLSLSKPFAALGRFARKHMKGKIGRIFATSLATFIVYFVIGIWHGASWRYIAFGFWNGGLITLALLLAGPFAKLKKRLRIDEKALWFVLFQVARTNVIVFFGRYITRAPRLRTAAGMVKDLFFRPGVSSLWNGTLFTLGLTWLDFAVILLGMAAVLGVEFYQERGGRVRAALEKKSFFVQWLAILIPLLVLVCFGLLRGGNISVNFIYQQF